MKTRFNHWLHFFCTAAMLTASSFAIAADKEPAPKEPTPLVDIAADGVEARFKPTSNAVTVQKTDKGVVVTIKKGTQGYPGIDLSPESGETWDLSARGHVATKITNLGKTPIGISLRVDDNGDWQTNPTNCETFYINPNANGQGKVTFGYSWGKPAYKLKSAQVKTIKLFTGAAQEEISFRIESVVAGGATGDTLPVDPNTIRVKPAEGGLLFGAGFKPVPSQLSTKEAGAVLEGELAKLTFKAGKKGQTVSIRPAKGRWDLREATEVRVSVKNIGTAPVTLKARVEMDENTVTSWASTDEPLAPDAVQEIVVPFIDKPVIMSAKGYTYGRILTDQIANVTIIPSEAIDATVLVQSVKAAVTAPAESQEWLGKRPPVEGEWSQTFSDDFDGSAVDTTKWNLYGEN